MITATRVLEFDAGHRLLKHEGKCAHAHGHRYRVEVTCQAMKPEEGELDMVGRVIDFSEIKRLVGGFIDETLDHAFLVDQNDKAMLRFLACENQRHFAMSSPPTAENIAQLLLDASSSLLADVSIDVVSVKVWETPNCFAVATKGNP